jgi:hypothetical protein
VRPRFGAGCPGTRQPRQPAAQRCIYLRARGEVDRVFYAAVGGDQSKRPRGKDAGPTDRQRILPPPQLARLPSALAVCCCPRCSSSALPGLRPQCADSSFKSNGLTVEVKADITLTPRSCILVRDFQGHCIRSRPQRQPTSSFSVVASLAQISVRQAGRGVQMVEASTPRLDFAWCSGADEELAIVGKPRLSNWQDLQD